MRRRPTTKALPWPPATTALLGLYSVVTVAFWAYFLTRLLPFIVVHAGRYGRLAIEFGRTVLMAPRSLTWAIVKEFVTSTYVLLFAVLMLVRLVTAVLPKMRRPQKED